MRTAIHAPRRWRRGGALLPLVLLACAALDTQAPAPEPAPAPAPPSSAPPPAPDPDPVEVEDPPADWSSAELLDAVLAPEPFERADALPRPEPGPVADFAEADFIATHFELEEVTHELPKALSAILGPRHVVERYAPHEVAETPAGVGGEVDTTLLWMRDYQPLFVRRADGSLKVLRYLSPNPNRTRYEPLGLDPPPVGAGRRLFYPEPGQPNRGRWLFTETLPLVHENGNLVSTGRYVFVTQRIFEDNGRPPEAPHLAQFGYKARTPMEVLDTLARALERPTSDIIVLPTMPGEATGHVDLFLMALGPKAVLVPEVRDEAIDLLTDEEEKALALDVRNFLDEQSAYLTRLGLTVRRLPMLPPLLMPSVDQDADQRDAVLYSPANGLLVRLPGRAVALLPTFDAPDRPDAYRELNRRYQQTWAAFFRDRGWTPRLVDATLLGRYLGLFRCVTAMVPR
jgi:hypothetical protein